LLIAFIKVSRKKITNLGSNSLKIPLLIIRPKKKLRSIKLQKKELLKNKSQTQKTEPVITIICGIHGDETSALRVIKQLLEKINLARGEIRIVLFANPLAMMNKSRFISSEGIDINRIFPGNEKSISGLTAKKILELCKTSNCVIDIHNFEMRTPLMGIVVNSADKLLNEKNISIAKIFAPKQIWLIDASKKEENKFSGSLGSELNKLKITNIALELNHPLIVTTKQIDECCDGLLRIMDSFSMLKSQLTKDELNSKLIAELNLKSIIALKLNTRSKLKKVLNLRSDFKPNKTLVKKSEFNSEFIFNRKGIIAPRSGLFVSDKKLFSKVNKNDVLGKIFDFELQRELEIISPIKGRVMQIACNKFVFSGDEILAIGMEVKK
jgi:predicted deacylase